MSVKKTQEEFVLEVAAIHGDTYDLSFVEYRGVSVKVSVVCKKHGKFKKWPSDLINGSGCPSCGHERKTGRKANSQEQFLTAARNVHQDFYDYAFVRYEHSQTLVEIYCNRHKKSFMQTPAAHLAGQGCPICGREAMSAPRRTPAEFIEQAQQVHADKYEYTEAVYTSVFEKVNIFCNACQEYFLQRASDHLSGSGCPSCSRGGFDPRRAAILYAYDILGHSSPITGFGITGNKRSRHRDHLRNLKKAGMGAVSYYVSPVISGLLAAEIEKKLREEFASTDDFPVVGFLREHTTSRFKSVVAFIEEEIEKKGGQYGNP